MGTTGATEAHNYLATGKDVQLAEQQLVDCANDFDCHGCNGGLPSKAFEYRHYAGGVYDSTTCKSSPQDVNHAVLAVGFDTDKKSGKDYYIVKNSWGSSFGVEGGYFWMVRGKNMCGVGDCASFPVMKGETGIVA